MTGIPAPTPAPALLPCPFCGDRSPFSGEIANNALAGYVNCDMCDRDGHLVVKRGLTEAAAIAAWNRRAPAVSDAPAAVRDAEAHKAVMTFYDGNHLMEEDVVAHAKMRRALEDFVSRRTPAGQRTSSEALSYGVTCVACGSLETNCQCNESGEP